MRARNETHYQCCCCNHFTLDEVEAYEICRICFWEDDGQNSDNADEVLGGPNSDYSLTEARKNFAQFGVMFRPADPRYKDAVRLKR